LLVGRVGVAMVRGTSVGIGTWRAGRGTSVVKGAQKGRPRVVSRPRTHVEPMFFGYTIVA
jgi:hypothetical protein